MNSKILFTTLMALSVSLSAQAQKTTSSKKRHRVPATAASATTDLDSPASVGSSTGTYVVAERAESNAALTEYAYQPKQGRTALTATPQILSQSVSVQPRGGRESTDDIRTNLVVLRAQRGLANNLSWSAEVGVGSQEASRAGEDSSQSKGLTDLTLGLRQVRDINNAQLFYGADVSLSLAERETSYAYRGGRSSDGNMFSGGHTLAPFVGLQMDRREFLVGGTAQLQYLFDRTETSRASTGERISIDRRGEHVAALAAFIERPMPKILFGAKASLAVATSSDTDARVGSTKLEFSSNSYQILGAGVYAKFSPSSTKAIDILPSLSLSKTMGASGGSLSLQEAQQVSLAVAIRAAL